MIASEINAKKPRTIFVGAFFGIIFTLFFANVGMASSSGSGSKSKPPATPPGRYQPAQFPKFPVMLPLPPPYTYREPPPAPANLPPLPKR